MKTNLIVIDNWSALIVCVANNLLRRRKPFDLLQLPSTTANDLNATVKVGYIKTFEVFHNKKSNKVLLILLPSRGVTTKKTPKSVPISYGLTSASELKDPVINKPVITSRNLFQFNFPHKSVISEQENGFMYFLIWHSRMKKKVVERFKPFLSTCLQTLVVFKANSDLRTLLSVHVSSVQGVYQKRANGTLNDTGD